MSTITPVVKPKSKAPSPPKAAPTLPNRLREVRESKGLSLGRLAEMVGTDKSQISRLESGERGLDIPWMTRLSRALGVSAAELLPRDVTSEEFERAIIADQEAAAGPELRSNAVRPFLTDGQLGQPRDLPVYGRALAGTVEEKEDEGWLEFNGERMDILQRPPALAAVPDAYAVWVSGPSMEPRYFDGEVVFVNPRKPVRVGNFVVAQIKPRRPGDAPRGLVKRLKAKSAGTVVLASLNPPDAPLIEIPAGRVISLHRIVLGGEG